MSSPDEFSIVLTIAEKDTELVGRTLPSWMRLRAPDVVICVDSPASEGLLKEIKRATGGDGRARVVQVPPNTGWKFRHAYTRREGFMAARFEKILTGDIDIVVNGNALRAVELVGRDNVGLVSLAKRRGGSTLGEPVRNFSKMVARVVRKRHFFTGLYAMYRPYWLDTEDSTDLGMLSHPHDRDQGATEAVYLGEDVFLRDSMVKKHSVIYLQDVGGTDLRTSLEDRAPIQAKLGESYYMEGRPLWYVLGQSILYARGTLLGTYLHLAVAEGGVAKIVAGYLAALTVPFRFLFGRILRRAGIKRVQAVSLPR